MILFKPKRWLFFLAAAAGLMACAPEGERGLQGQLLFQDRPLAGAQVEIYLKAEQDRSVQPFAVATTDAEGRYTVSLPDGHYYVIGKKRENSADGSVRMLMADSPGNPHAVDRKVARVPSFNLREMGRQGGLVADAGTGLTGQITATDGQPVARAYVYLYTQDDAGLTGPSYGEAVQTDEDGRFQVDLPAGTYYLVARKRAAGGRSGELEPGDYNSPYPVNPVIVPRGQVVALKTFPLTEIDAAIRDERRAAGAFKATETVVTGDIRDAHGRPVSGVYVFAYLDRRMVGKPVHISAPSAADGSFRLYLAEGGRYYIGARSGFGGPLEPGEWIGTFDVQPDHSLEIADQRQQALGTITVREVW